MQCPERVRTCDLITLISKNYYSTASTPWRNFYKINELFFSLFVKNNHYLYRNIRQTMTTIKDQIDKLKKRGLIIDDDDKAAEVLSDIGYYRLGFYWFPFEKGNRVRNRLHQFKEGYSFKNAVDLYYFDYELRAILLKYISRIEINLRTKIIYFVSNYYPNSPTWFADPNIVKAKWVNEFSTKGYGDLVKHNPILRQHHNKYINDKYAPAWKTIEFMPLGSVQYLYENLKDVKLKQKIADEFSINKVAVFENYIEAVRNVRNACAHGNVIYDLHLPESIRKGPAGKISQPASSTLYGAVKVISYLLRQISDNREKDMLQEIIDLENNCLYKEIIDKLNISFQ